MAIFFFNILRIFCIFIVTRADADTSSNLTSLPSPFLSGTTFLPNYQEMVKNLKIFVYEPQKSRIFQSSLMTESSGSIFQSRLLNSHFITPYPEQAHLFYLPFPANLDFSDHQRSVSKYIRDLRMDLPFWNRTLGADHFYVSCTGLGIESDRNLVELKKNSIQVSCFPVRSWSEGEFIPHKDIALPPLVKDLPVDQQKVGDHGDGEVLAYCNVLTEENPEILLFLKELRADPDFFIETQPLDPVLHAHRLSTSKFCLFFHGHGRVLALGEALRFGCVPVVISSHPIFDLSFTDVLKWNEIVVFVGKGGGVHNLKSVLKHTCGQRYGAMRELGQMVSKHFEWNIPTQPYDSFYMVVFQLWLRRHTIRYARRQCS